MMFTKNTQYQCVGPKKADYNTKITEIEEKTPDHDKYIAAVFDGF